VVRTTGHARDVSLPQKSWVVIGAMYIVRYRVFLDKGGDGLREREIFPVAVSQTALKGVAPAEHGPARDGHGVEVASCNGEDHARFLSAASLPRRFLEEIYELSYFPEGDYGQQWESNPHTHSTWVCVVRHRQTNLVHRVHVKDDDCVRSDCL